MKTLTFLAVCAVAGCGASAAPATSESEAPPAATDAATPAATGPVASPGDTCAQGTGTCVRVTKAVSCTKLEQGIESGCGANMGCCIK